MNALDASCLASRLRGLLVEWKLPELVGGELAFEAGLDELKVGLLSVAAELVHAQLQGVDLSDAVFDTERFPHTCRMHGVLADAMEMDAPSEMMPWIRKILATGPLPDVPEINRSIATLAAWSPNVSVRMLARFGLFEMACLQQRLVLRLDGVHLELMNGRRRAVEIIAEQEVEAACVLAAASEDFLAAEDPVGLVAQMATTCLARYIDALRGELGQLSADVHAQLERRKLIIEAAARVEPVDRILIFNLAEDTAGEERLSPGQLRRLHPILLGELTDDNAYKRVERLADRVRSGTPKPTNSILDLILEATRETRS